MLFGRNLNGELVRATPKATACCPLCNAPLRSKCGEAKLQIWHWAHVSKDCDPWHEGEGDWHLAWKARAPTDCIEVAIPPHRADIRTRNGMVIELQASAIDAAEIVERERFYDRMIWLLDGRAWRSASRFRFAKGRYRDCERCAVGRLAPLPAGERCRECYRGQTLDTSLGDRYRWNHRRTSFDSATRPVYVDTGENVVMLEGRPSRIGNGRIISYADFCLNFGLSWDPNTPVSTTSFEDNWYPELLAPPRPKKLPGQPNCVDPMQRPLAGIELTMTVNGVSLRKDETFDNPSSVSSVAVRLRSAIDQTECAQHEVGARVVVPITEYSIGWAIHKTCCEQVSAQLVSNLQAAQKELSLLKRRARKLERSNRDNGTPK
jgi:Competence protein CoiA-like family